MLPIAWLLAEDGVRMGRIEGDRSRSDPAGTESEDLPTGVIHSALYAFGPRSLDRSGRRTMTAILNQIRRFIGQLAPAPVCDGCIAERLDIAPSDELRSYVGELAGTGGYRRERDDCSLCGSPGPVIRKLP